METQKSRYPQQLLLIVTDSLSRDFFIDIACEIILINFHPWIAVLVLTSCWPPAIRVYFLSWLCR